MFRGLAPTTKECRTPGPIGETGAGERGAFYRTIRGDDTELLAFKNLWRPISRSFTLEADQTAEGRINA